jgi:NAD(P)H-nitrite reductase large subunit
MAHRAIACISRSALAIAMLCAITVAAPGCGGTKPTIEQVIQSSNQRLRQAVLRNVADGGRKAQMLMVVDQIETV